MPTIRIIVPEDVKDKDLKALYVLESAMKMSTPKMRKANIDFIIKKWKVK